VLRGTVTTSISTHVVFKVRQYHAPHNIQSIQIKHTEGGRDKIKVDSLCRRPEQTVQLQKKHMQVCAHIVSECQLTSKVVTNLSLVSCMLFFQVLPSNLHIPVDVMKVQSCQEVTVGGGVEARVPDSLM